MACTCGHPGLGCECHYAAYVPPPKKDKPKLKITKKASVTLPGTRLTVGEMRELIDEFNDDAVLRIGFHKGYDQRDNDYVTLEVSFE